MCSAVDSFAYNSIRRHLQSLPNSTGPNLVEFLKHQCMKSSTLLFTFDVRHIRHSWNMWLILTKRICWYHEGHVQSPYGVAGLPFQHAHYHRLHVCAATLLTAITGMAKFDPSQNQNPFTGWYEIVSIYIASGRYVHKSIL